MRHTDIKQSRVTPTLPLVAVAAAVEAVVLMVLAPLGPPVTTATATLALGELECMNCTARPFHWHHHSEHEKQAGHGWGKVEGQAEWSDEKAGADIAATEVKDAAGNTEPEVAAAPEPEEEDNTKSYEQYLADLAEKRQALAGDSLAIRKANEGSSQKFPEGKPVERAHEEYFAGAGAKQHRAKENKTKNSLALDGQYYAAPDTGDRGRGGARGGRGEGRGGRGRGEGRGRGGRGRGEGRGGAPSGARTEQRSGPRGGAINTKDESAFPSLGA
jgi:plasminogen activator inhibitor 1 RNA-binding protein